MLKQVPTVRTTFTTKELCAAFIKAWKEKFNAVPSKKSLAILVGQHNLETGKGNECWAFNIANIKCPKDDPNKTINYCALVGVWEIVNGKKVILSEKDSGSWFLAFDTLDDGVKFYLNFLNNRRYAVAWPAVVSGDPANFVHLLRQQGYFTADEAVYLKGVMGYYNQFMKDQSYEQALAEINATPTVSQENNTEPMPIVPADIPPLGPSPTIISDPPITLSGWQQIISFIMSLLSIFSKKNN